MLSHPYRNESYIQPSQPSCNKSYNFQLADPRILLELAVKETSTAGLVTICVWGIAEGEIHSDCTSRSNAKTFFYNLK